MGLQEGLGHALVTSSTGLGFPRCNWRPWHQTPSGRAGPEEGQKTRRLPRTLHPSAATPHGKLLTHLITDTGALSLLPRAGALPASCPVSQAFHLSGDFTQR